jgi:hypothetical protein
MVRSHAPYSRSIAYNASGGTSFASQDRLHSALGDHGTTTLSARNVSRDRFTSRTTYRLAVEIGAKPKNAL